MGIAPADDIIIRVEEPLSFESFDKIIISVMAKKVAAGTTHLVLDIPIGKTAKIHRYSEGENVAKKFENLARRFNIKVICDVNEILEPAGRGIGPILEVRDALYVLEQKTDRPLRLETKSLRLAGKLLNLCYKEKKNGKNGEDEARKILESGAALRKFQEIVKAQGGDNHITSDSLLLAKNKFEFHSSVSGKIKDINNYNLNTIARILGSPNDKKAGVYLLKKLDHSVNKNEPIFILYSDDRYRLKEAEATLKNLPIFRIE